MTGLELFQPMPHAKVREPKRHAMPRHILLLTAAMTLAACASTEPTFFETLQTQCGQTLTGRVVSNQAVDADWRAQTLTLGPIDCTGEAVTPDMPQVSGDSLVMPLAVGDDASRVWLVHNSGGALEFRHFHYEPDGSPSPVTSYGGLALPGGTATRQQFPADAATQANFTANGIARSNPNIWTFTLDKAAGTLTYALARPATDTDEARDFRAEFVLE